MVLFAKIAHRNPKSVYLSLFQGHQSSQDVRDYSNKNDILETLSE